MPIAEASPTATMIRRYGFRSSFSHDSEVIYPGFYSVFLDTPQVGVELLAFGTHAGAHRYTFTPGSQRTILFDICHSVSSDSVIGLAGEDPEVTLFGEKLGTFASPSKEGLPRGGENSGPDFCPLASVTVSRDADAVRIRGHTLHRGSLSRRNGRGVDIFFYGELLYSENPALANHGTWSNGRVFDGREGEQNETSGNLGVFLNFGAASAGATQLNLRVGISFVSQTNAERNYVAQAAGRSFDQGLEDVANQWASKLSFARVETPDEAEKTKFYTALYRTYMSPTIYSEADGSYLGMDNQVHQIDAGHAYYSDLSLWDTFRTQNPWLTLAAPDVALDVVRSMILMYKEGGDFSRWPLANVYTGCMFGDNHVLITLDAYVKGWTDFDLAGAYPGMRQTAVGPRPVEGRGGIQDYITYGYVPLEVTETGTPNTLSYAYSDYALSVFAEELGLAEDQAVFRNRSFNYRHLWEPETQLMCPKYRNGTFKCPEVPAYPFHPNYVEGNVYHYNWDVPHDLAGLVSLYPSPEAFIEQLETMFENSTQTNRLLFQSNLLPNPYYWHGNEHNLLFPWVFHAGGRPDLTQYWTRWVLAEKYSDLPGGIPGNDDYGTLSAWYLFGSLGFYPVTGLDWYFVGSPVFDEAEVVVPAPGGGTSTIRVVSHGNSAEAVYVERVLLNGTPLTTPYITHRQLMANPTLEFWMTTSRTNFWA